MDRLDNRTVAELIEPVDREYRAWRLFIESEDRYKKKYETDNREEVSK